MTRRTLLGRLLAGFTALLAGWFAPPRVRGAQITNEAFCFQDMTTYHANPVASRRLRWVVAVSTDFRAGGPSFFAIYACDDEAEARFDVRMINDAGSARGRRQLAQLGGMQRTPAGYLARH